MKKFNEYYDSEIDSLLIVFKVDEEDYYEEIAPGINVEFNKKKEVIGVEILNTSRLYRIKPIPTEYNFEISVFKTKESLGNNTYKSIESMRAFT